MLTHSSFQFNICTTHVNPPIDMFVRNANITMGRRVERTNSRTEKNQVKVCLRLQYTALDIFHHVENIENDFCCLPKMRLATC